MPSCPLSKIIQVIVVYFVVIEVLLSPIVVPAKPSVNLQELTYFQLIATWEVAVSCRFDSCNLLGSH